MRPWELLFLFVFFLQYRYGISCETRFQQFYWNIILGQLSSIELIFVFQTNRESWLHPQPNANIEKFAFAVIWILYSMPMYIIRRDDFWIMRFVASLRNGCERIIYLPLKLYIFLPAISCRRTHLSSVKFRAGDGEKVASSLYTPNYAVERILWKWRKLTYKTHHQSKVIATNYILSKIRLSSTAAQSARDISFKIKKKQDFTHARQH